MAECWQEVLLQLRDSWAQLWCVRRTFGVAQVAQHQWWERRVGAGWHRSPQRMVSPLAWALAQLLLWAWAACRVCSGHRARPNHAE